MNAFGSLGVNVFLGCLLLSKCFSGSLDDEWQLIIVLWDAFLYIGCVLDKFFLLTKLDKNFA